MAHAALLNSAPESIAEQDPLGIGTHATPGLQTDEPQVSNRLMFTGEVPNAADILDVASLGKSITIESDRKIEFTLAVAKRHLELPEIIVNDSHIDRKLDKSHVSYLLRCMKRNLFRPEFVTIITCVCNEAIGDNPAGTEYRINGMHTSWGRLYMPGDYPCQVRFIRYRAAKAADLRQLYFSTDRGKGRNRGHVIVTIVAGTPGYEGVTDRLVKALAGGLGFWLEAPTGRVHGPYTPVSELKKRFDIEDLGYLMLRDQFDLTQRVKNFFMHGPQTRDVQKIQTRAVMAAVFETFSVLPTRAHEFWEPVRDGVGCAIVDDPRSRLHKLLQNSLVMTTTDSVRGTGHVAKVGGKRIGGPEDAYAWCINAWNAWRKGQELKFIAGAKGTTRPKAK